MKNANTFKKSGPGCGWTMALLWMKQTNKLNTNDVTNTNTMSFISPIKISAKGIKETLSLFEDLKKQQKFAQALTAQHAAREVKQWTIHKLLPIKKPGLGGHKRRTGWTTTKEFGFMVSPKKVNRNQPWAVIESNASWIQDHEKGSTRKPRHPALLGGVPLATTGKGRPRKSKYGVIPAFKGPFNMVNRTKKGFGMGSSGRIGWQTFIGKTKNGRKAVYIRTKNGGKEGIAVQYVINKRLKIKPALKFKKKGKVIARAAYIKLYPGNFLRALKSSNRRKVTV